MKGLELRGVCKQRQGLRMQLRPSRQDTSSIERQLATSQIGTYATGLTHDHRKRGNIEYVHVGLDHEVEAAAREQVIMQEIAVAADAPAAADQLAERIPTR